MNDKRFRTALSLEQLAALLEQNFGPAGEDSNAYLESLRHKQFPEYQLIAAWIALVLQQQQQSFRIVGISGAQGTGKSTLADMLASALEDCQLSVVNVSLDDYYLTQRERQGLAATVHPLLATRGVPGTHDTAWLARTLRAFTKAGSRRAVSVEVPRFDKGLDDRKGSQVVSGEVLILEGWCLGATPEVEQALERPINTLEAEEDPDGRYRRWVNSQLDRHYVPLWQQVDFWVTLRVPGMAAVRRWRAQQELELPVERQMSEAKLRRFIDHYERLTSAQLRASPRAPGLAVDLESGHGVAGVERVGQLP